MAALNAAAALLLRAFGLRVRSGDSEHPGPQRCASRRPAWKHCARCLAGLTSPGFRPSPATATEAPARGPCLALSRLAGAGVGEQA